MTTVNELSSWIQNLLKTSNSYSNKFYYDGHGVISSYEESIKEQKNIIKIIESKENILKEIHEKRLERPTLFAPLYKDINRLEMENHRLELQMANNELSHSRDTLIVLKNLVAFSKIMNVFMQELSENSKTNNLVKNIRKFQLDAEPTIDSLRTHLDNRNKKNDEDNFKHR